MFLSKIFFFIVAAAAAVALTIALLLPRPADRDHAVTEHQRLAFTCDVVKILLTENARTRTGLVATFSRSRDLIARIADANGAGEIDAGRALAARKVAADLVDKVKGPPDTAEGDQKKKDIFVPDFAIVIDRRGRVVTRVKVGESDYGDVVAGRPLIDDALAGYLRDDLWIVDGRLYLVAAAPVASENATEYVGAVVLGHAVTAALADRLTKDLGVGLGFYLGGDPVASTSTTPLDPEALVAAVGALKGGVIEHDCAANRPFNVRAGEDELAGLVSRLPGEAQRAQAFYAIFIKRPEVFGFGGRVGQITKSDLSFGSFPWLLVAGGLVLVLVCGLGLMVIESDRPLRKLNAEAVRLAKGEIDRLGEDNHRGKFGSIARSVNIHIDKVGREAKTAKKDLDQLLGPVPEGSLGAIHVDLLGSPMPARAGGGSTGPSPALPPSEFRFSDSAPKMTSPTASPGLDLGPAPPRAAPANPGARPAPPARPAPARPPGLPPRAPTPPPMPARALDNDPFGPRDINADPSGIGAVGAVPDNPYFKQVFDQFVALKKTCNEQTAGLTYAKFAEKLKRNRDELIQKTACRDVRFTVYVKDGKAALKATPVRDGE